MKQPNRKLQRLRATLRETYIWASAVVFVGLNLFYWLVPYQGWCRRCGDYFDNLLPELMGTTFIYVVVNLVVRQDDPEQALQLREMRLIRDELAKLPKHLPAVKPPPPKDDSPTNHSNP